MGTPTANTSSFTDKNPVSLSDWWLTEIDPGFEGKKLGVSGFTFRKGAMRLFNSAAIVKCFDAYSHETADGNLIIIEGMINKDRTCMNGFSAKVCDRFLIGFPSCWDYYATEYFQNKSLHSNQTQTAGTSYPANPDESSIDSICNWLSSAGGTMTDDFKNELKEFLKSTTTEPMIQTPTMINNLPRADSTGSIDDFLGDVSSNTVLETCGEKNQREGQKVMLIKTPLQSIRETEVTSDIERSTSANHGDCDDIQVLREEESIIESINSVVTINTGVR